MFGMSLYPYTHKTAFVCLAVLLAVGMAETLYSADGASQVFRPSYFLVEIAPHQLDQRAPGIAAIGSASNASCAESRDIVRTKLTCASGVLNCSVCEHRALPKPLRQASVRLPCSMTVMVPVVYADGTFTPCSFTFHHHAPAGSLVSPLGPTIGSPLRCPWAMCRC
jgi:hypothetical protein